SKILTTVSRRCRPPRHPRWLASLPARRPRRRGRRSRGWSISSGAGTRASRACLPQDDVDDLAGDDDETSHVVVRIAGMTGQQAGDLALADPGRDLDGEA